VLSRTWRLDTGFAAVAAISALGLVSLAIASAGLAVKIGLGANRLQLASDAAALAASETARGLVAGFSCANAEQIAKSFGVQLDTCRIVGFGASVELSKTELGLNFSAASTAGSP
jgi:hypothetical protein